MTFTTKTYTTIDDSYETLANTIIEETTVITETEYSKSLTKDVATGIKKHLKNKNITSGENLILVSDATFYLNMVSTASASHIKKETRNETSINNIATTGPHLFFTVAEFKDYKDYAWKYEEFENIEERNYSGFNTENTKYSKYEFQAQKQDNAQYYNRKIQHKKNLAQLKVRHGKIGSGVKGINGDKSNSTKQKEGYVYVFNKEDVLKHTFVITKGKYQEVSLSKNDCSYSKKIGNTSKNAKIPNFFKQDKNEEFQQYQFVFSKVKLTKSRLFPEADPYTPKFVPSISSRKIPVSKYGLSALGEDKRPGCTILSDYIVDATTIPNAETYHLSTKILKDKGIEVIIHFPDPIAELNRRTRVLRKKIKEKEEWINTPFRMEQYFLYTTIKQMLKKDTRIRFHANKDFMEEWHKEYQHLLKIKSDAMFFAGGNVMSWLEEPELIQCLFNHIQSENDKKQYNNALKSYWECLTEFGKCFFLPDIFYERELNNYNSFLCVLYDLHGQLPESNEKENYIKKSFLLNDTFFDNNRVSHSVGTSRKAEQAILGIMTTNSPKVMKFLGNKVVLKLIDRVSMYFIKKNIPKTVVDGVEILDQNFIEKAKFVRVVKLAFEALNLTLAIKVFLEDSDHKARNLAAVIGSSSDIITENHLLLKMALKNTSNPYLRVVASSTKYIPPLQLISGILDTFVGADSAWEAYQQGEIMLSWGHSVFAVGGAIAAIGAGMVIAGGASTSTGVGAAPGAIVMTVGVVVQGIGTAINWWWDNAIVKDWVDRSIFGDNPKILEIDKFKTFKSREIIDRLLDEKLKGEVSTQAQLEIKELNEILLGFTVSASFKQVTHRGNPKTTINFEITPRLMTKNTLLTFSDISIFMTNRTSERIYESVHSLFGEETNDGNRKTRKWSKDDFILDLNTVPHYNSCYVEKNSKGIITLVKRSITYDGDVDKIVGNITLNPRTHSRQVITIPFDEEASFYE